MASQPRSIPIPRTSYPSTASSFMNHSFNSKTSSSSKLLSTSLDEKKLREAVERKLSSIKSTPKKDVFRSKISTPISNSPTEEVILKKCWEYEGNQYAKKKYWQDQGARMSKMNSTIFTIKNSKSDRRGAIEMMKALDSLEYVDVDEMKKCVTESQVDPKEQARQLKEERDRSRLWRDALLSAQDSTSVGKHSLPKSIRPSSSVNKHLQHVQPRYMENKKDGQLSARELLEKEREERLSKFVGSQKTSSPPKSQRTHRFTPRTVKRSSKESQEVEADN